MSMNKYKTFKGLMGANNKYIKALAKFAEMEEQHLSMIQYESASFGEAIVDLMESRDAVMNNNSISPALRVMQALYYDTQIEGMYVDFFVHADEHLDGKLSELFDEELLIARVVH